MKFTKRLMSVVLAAVMVIGTLAVSVSADSIQDTAVDLPSGTKKSFVLNSGSSKDYKVTLSKKGTLTLNITSKIGKTNVYLYDTNGDKIDASDVSSTTGSLSGDYRSPVVLAWNNVVEKYTGKVKYELSKGTYYIRVERGYGYSGNGKVSLTATYGSDDNSDGKISYLTLQMEVGDTLRLGAVTEPADAEVTWTSSKTAVATVSASGKVTAKKEGKTIITAKCGSSTQKIQIIVV